jgi:hypothetical protein
MADAAAFRVVLDGTVMIGEKGKEIAIPIATVIPPQDPGEFVFDYENADPATAAHLPVGDFIIWLATTFGIDVTKEQLPASLQTLVIAVLKLHFDTTGNIDIKIQLGSEAEGGGWSSVWQPIDSLPNFKLDGLTIETTNMDELVNALLSLDAVATPQAA